MGSLPSLKEQFFTDAGAVLNGGKLNFYITGTSTRKNTYSDYARTAANANPVVADAYGRFGEIYMIQGEPYRVVLTDSADVVIFTLDGIYDDRDSLHASPTRLKQVAANPLDYNSAVGDGVANEAAAVQAAVDAASGTVDLLGKVFRCDSTITLRSGITLKNGTLDFSNSASSDYVRILGTRGTGVNLTANASAGDTTLTTGTITGIAVDDLLFVRSNGIWDGSITLGELVKVRSASGTTITLSGKLDGAYATADTARYEEITPVKAVRLEGVIIKCGATANIPLLVEMAERVEVVNCRFENFTSDGVVVKSSMDVSFDNCWFHPASVTTPAALRIGEASANVTVSGCSFRFAAMGVGIGKDYTNDGVTRFVRVSDCYFMDCVTGVDIDTASRYVEISDSEFRAGAGTTYGVDNSGTDVRIVDNDFYFHAGGAVRHSGTCGASWVLDVSGNNIKNTASSGVADISVSTSTTSTVAIKIRDNHLSEGLISVTQTSGTGGGCVEICGNTISDGGATAPILCTNLTSDIVRIDGNTINSTGGVLSINCTTPLASIEMLSISGNKIRKTGTLGAIAITPSGAWAATSIVRIDDNHISSSAASGVGYIVFTAAAGTYGSLSANGNTINIAGASGANAIDFDVQNATVNAMDVSRNTITVTTTASDGFELTKGGTGTIDTLAVNGNSITGVLAVGVNVVGSPDIIAMTCNNNTINGSSITHGIVVDATYVAVCGNSIYGPISTAGILIDDANSSITGNSVYVSGTAAGKGISCTNTGVVDTNMLISGNQVTTYSGVGVETVGTSNSARNASINGNTVYQALGGASSWPINVNGYIAFAGVTGNVSLRGDDAAPNIRVAGTAAGAITNFNVTGNVASNGTYGINASNFTTSLADANILNSMATGVENGLSPTVIDVAATNNQCYQD